MNKNVINEIQNSIGLNRLAIFIGAGASISYPSNLPSFYNLRNQTISELLQNIVNYSYIKDILQTTKTKPELLFQIIWEYMNDSINPIEGFQYAPPNINHLLIANLCQTGIKLIITTNFDQCIEKALRLFKIPFKTIYGTPSNENSYKELCNSIIKPKDIILWKSHGDSQIPSSLCYTMTQIACLNNSNYLKAIYNLIFDNFDLLTLGYSGYDDDFFPLIYEYPLKHSTQCKIFWNSYEKVKSDTPPYRLLQNWKNKMKIIVGDMKGVLFQILGGNSYDDMINENNQHDWKYHLHKEIAKINIDCKISIIGKYLFVLQKYQLANHIWNYGLQLLNISEENRLRFIINIKPEMTEYVFNESIKKGFYKLSSIALFNLINKLLEDKKIIKSYEYIRQFRKLSTLLPKYFLLSDYYKSAYNYFKKKYKDNNGRINKLEKKILEKRIAILIQEGNIIDLISAISSLASSLATEDSASMNDFEQIQKYIPILESYNIHSELAGLYYSTAILAHRVSTKEMELIYLDLCENEIRLCYELEIYQQEVFWELSAVINHERAQCGTSKDAIILCKKSIEFIDKIQNTQYLSRNKDEFYGIFYDSLGANYLILGDYKNAKLFLEKSLYYQKKSHSLRGEARVLHELGKLYYKMGNKQLSKEILMDSLNKLKLIGENTKTINQTLFEFGYT